MSKRVKVMCAKGAGQWAKRKMPTSLVDCPVCARKNLGSTPVRREGGCDFDGYSSADGCYYGVVPPHSEEALRPEEIRDFDPLPDTAEQAFKNWCDSPEWRRYGTDFDLGMI